jgi:anti-sigma28 factor (negative regulator of flagellin synthesis)
MDIRKISQPSNAYDIVKVRKEKAREEKDRRVDDSVELSPEAMKLFQSEETKKVDMIRDRVQSGYYSRKEVVEKVADEILQQFTQP